MKQRITRTVLFLFLLIVGISVSVLLNNLSYFTNENASVKLQKDSIKFMNWSQNGSTYISLDDPQILFVDIIGSYVEQININGSLEGSTSNVQVFYTESLTENFSEEKSLIIPLKANNGLIVIDVNKQVQRLRVDLTDQIGVKLIFNSVTIVYSSLQIDPFTVALGFLFAGIFMIPVFFPLRRWKNLLFHLVNFKKYDFLLYTLVKKDMTTKYRRSVLGILWSVLNPLLMMIVITLVFQHLFRFQVENFPLYYLSGWLIYNFVSEATTGAMTSVVSAGALIRKVYIPKYIFPIEKSLFSLINTLFSLIAVIIMIFFLRAPLHPTILLFWVPLIFVLFFSIGLGMVLASLNVFFRDTGHLYGVCMMAWMYLTPVIYPVEILPSQILAIVRFNPLYHFVSYFRQLMLYGTIPTIKETAVCALISLGFFAVGLVIFKKKQDKFILFI